MVFFNEVMFFAQSVPGAMDITVEYSGVADSLSVKVMPHGFDYVKATTASYCAAMLYCTEIWLGDSGPMQAALDAKRNILELLATNKNSEVAA